MALFAGLLFGFGLSLSGMTNPQKVRSFLDIGGTWDPSLAFVMVGAIGVHALAYHLWLKKKSRPWLAPAFALPALRTIDGRLLAGSALFGIGWGLAGFCPGPALLSIVSGAPSVFVFVLAMLGGMLIPQKNMEALSKMGYRGERREDGSGSRVL